MKTMEKHLNLFFFCLYRLHYRSHLFLDKINPFYLLLKLPLIKRRQQKFGIDIRKEVNGIFGDKYSGLSVGFAVGYVVIVLIMFISAIANIFIGLFSPGIVLSIKHFIPIAILGYIIYYFYISRNDKYIQYFNTFEKLPRSEIRKCGWLSFAFIVFVMGLFMLGLRLALPPIKT